MDANSDWRDGFLFLGNQLSLDFLNTRPVIDGSPVELLPDNAALRRWLAAAGLSPKLAGDLNQLREFREAYRKAILDIEAGKQPAAAFIAKLNALLARYPFTEEIVRSESSLKRIRLNGHVFGAILDAVAELLTTADYSRIRKCDACVLHFYDTSKKGTRRWCSMRICGNRYKVAAYARRNVTEAVR